MLRRAIPDHLDVSSHTGPVSLLNEDLYNSHLCKYELFKYTITL